jgi:hypothetical protein
MTDHDAEMDAILGLLEGAYSSLIRLSPTTLPSSLTLTR